MRWSGSFCNLNFKAFDDEDSAMTLGVLFQQLILLHVKKIFFCLKIKLLPV